MIRSWLPVKTKARLARILCAPVCGRLIGILFRDRIPYRGLTFVTTSPHVAARAKAKLFWGIYEGTEVRFVNRYLPEGVAVVELGSSIGVLSCFIKKRIGPAAKLVCVEAHPEFGEIIAQNLHHNRLMSNVDIANAAVSMPGCESVTFVASSHNVSGRVWRDGEESAGRGMTVPACSLRQITANHELDHFSLVCDIEGAEAEFILGDPEALAGCDQCIIECHNTTHLDR